MARQSSSEASLGPPRWVADLGASVLVAGWLGRRSEPGLGVAAAPR